MNQQIEILIIKKKKKDILELKNNIVNEKSHL